VYVFLRSAWRCWVCEALHQRSVGAGAKVCCWGMLAVSWSSGRGAQVVSLAVRFALEFRWIGSSSGGTALIRGACLCG
jgi:hypothetical protein